MQDKSKESKDYQYLVAQLDLFGKLCKVQIVNILTGCHAFYYTTRETMLEQWMSLTKYVKAKHKICIAIAYDYKKKN